MSNWKELKSQDLQSEMVACLESLRPAIYQLVLNMMDDTDPEPYDYRDFDYYIDTYLDKNIILMWDGWEFASANTDHFKNAGEFIAWVIEAINTYYKEEEDE